MKIGKALKDMKRVDSDMCCEVTSSPKKKKTKEYPWSMNVNLQDQDLKTLGIDVGSMKTGTKVMMMVEGEVTQLESSEREGKKRQSMTIQMQKIAIEPKKKMTMKEAMDDDD